MTHETISILKFVLTVEPWVTERKKLFKKNLIERIRAKSIKQFIETLLPLELFKF